jgi:hypothetical protein
MRLSPLGTAATTGLLYQPQMIDEGDCGAIGGMKIGRGNRIKNLSFRVDSDSEHESWHLYVLGFKMACLLFARY